MTKGKKILVSVAVLFIGVALYINEYGDSFTPRINREEGKAIKTVMASSFLVETATRSGREPPENITSETIKKIEKSGKTGRYLPDASICSPRCREWKFLSAAKKDHGWYVYGADTTDTVPIIYLTGVKPEMCSQLQNASGQGYVIPKQVGAPFDPEKPGAYMPEGGSTTIRPDIPNTTGGGCFDNNVGQGTDNYIFYQVLSFSFIRPAFMER